MILISGFVANEEGNIILEHCKFRRGTSRSLIICTSLIFILFIGGEMAMRFYGFCNAPLYYNDPYTGYNLVANQSVKRFGNLFSTNEYSMRSAPLNDGEYRILLIGDSVLNGGVQTDQEKLASTMLEKKYKNEYGDVRILNISCGGWGIDNAVGVFEKYGNFDGKMLILVLSSHDAVGTISSRPIAGASKSFPDKQYPLAWIELVDRYLIPGVKRVLKIQSNETVNETNTSHGNEHSEGWEYFYWLSQDMDVPLIIYLHAEKGEIEAGQYDEKGQWIISFAEERGISVVTDIDVAMERDYKDHLHLSEDGQHVIYDVLDSVIAEFLKETIR